MREIKFRAWDIENKKFLELESISFGVNGVYKILIDKGTGSYAQKEKGFILMQYTGLKDKNGVEIYQGDAVKCKALSTTKTVLVEDIRNIPIEVVAFPTAYGGVSGEVEVIGNIYESPDLLEKE